MSLVTLAQIAQPLRLSEKFWRLPWPVLAVIGLLSAIGTASLYSVAGGSFEPWAERHAMRFFLCVALVIAMGLMPLAFWKSQAYPAYAVGLFLLMLVPLFGIEALGARRWLGFGGLTLQPSEIMKPALIAALARYYSDLDPDRISQPRYVLWSALLIAVPMVLTLRQPDLGTAVLFAVSGFGVMFMAGVSMKYFIAAGAALGAALPFAWIGLHDYQRRRIEVFLDPDRDPLGAGYHITQSKIALGSGGLTGRGFMEGTQSKLDFLPEKHTDFIFTMLGEEWGFAGTVAVVAIFGVLLALLMLSAQRCRTIFARLLVTGAALTIFVYVFINIAMVTGLVPVVGVPLPFVSYGGTAMVTTMTSIGLAASAHVHERLQSRRSAWS